HAEGLIARRERRAARTGAPAAAEEVEAPEVKIGGSEDGVARGLRPLGDHGEGLEARDADVAQIGAAAVPRHGEGLPMPGEVRRRRPLDPRVPAPADVAAPAVELRDELGDAPLRVVRVSDEEHPGGAALRYPVDER